MRLRSCSSVVRSPSDDEAQTGTHRSGAGRDALPEEGPDHYAVGMKDPEGNEFDIN